MCGKLELRPCRVGRPGRLSERHPQHHLPTAAPWLAPEATPYGGVTYEETPASIPYVDPARGRSGVRPSRSMSTPRGTPSPSATSTTAIDPIPRASASKSGSTPSPRATRSPRTRPSRSWPTAVRRPHRARRDPARIGLQARDVRDRARRCRRLTFVVDTSGSMEREGRLELVKDALRLLVRPARAQRHRGDRHVRRRCSRRAGADPGDRCEPDPRARSRDCIRADPRTSRRACGSATSSRGRRSPKTVSIASCWPPTASPTSASPIPKGSSGRSGATPMAASSWCRSASGWATTTTPSSSSSRTRATASTPTSTPSTRPAGCSPRSSPATLETVALDAKAQVEFEPRYRRGVPARRLREPGDRRSRLHQRRGAGRGDRGRPRGHRALRAAARRRRRTGPPSRDRPPALDRPRSRRRSGAEPGGQDRRARRLVPPDESRLPLRRHRRRDRRGPARQRAGGPGRPPTIADIADRDAERLPATDEVHAFLELLDDLAAMERKSATRTSDQGGPDQASATPGGPRRPPRAIARRFL